MPVFTNIAAYKFAPLTDLKRRREALLAFCQASGLKGTILLSPEGINLFVAGGAEEIDRLVAELRAIPGLEDLAPKFSESDHQPFNRMLVRIKKEIIAFGVEGIDPSRRPSPKLAARTLKQWLDEGRPVTLLDTRNDYEVRLGTFKGAHAAGIEHFRQFPEAVQQLPAEWKEQPVVMFCTGGIRCEKAGPFMEREGFRQIYQLDGGILKYFEECGGAHYDGECFVFDHRVGVDAGLQETATVHCFACLTPLTTDDQRDPRFVPSQSCPYCYRTSAERMAETIALRHAAIRRVTTPLPGSRPYENRRPFNVPAVCDGQTLLASLGAIFGHLPAEHWLGLCAAGQMLDGRGAPVRADQIVRAGERYFRVQSGLVEPEVSAAIRIVHEDEAIIVLEKPAPLPMHPAGRYNRNTLQSILGEAYAPEKPRPAHRLDANTTGIVLFARTRHFANLLQPQFAQGAVEKEYLARVQGHPKADEFTCHASISPESGEFGSRDVAEAEELAARTDFQVLERLADGTSLLLARPRTGRTNQIRVHARELGLPICGDPAYVGAGRLGETMTIAVGDAPLCLHAFRLTFTHPVTRERLTFESAAPEWAGGKSNPAA